MRRKFISCATTKFFHRTPNCLPEAGEQLANMANKSLRARPGLVRIPRTSMQIVYFAKQAAQSSAAFFRHGSLTGHQCWILLKLNRPFRITSRQLKMPGKQVLTALKYMRSQEC